MNKFQSLRNVMRLIWKEIQSLRRDPVMAFLIVYAFSVSVYTVANGIRTEVKNATVAVVDSDKSILSGRIKAALQPPFFQQPRELPPDAVDEAMDKGQFTFVLDLPHELAQDVLRGRRPSVQLNIDATAISQAGMGAAYIEQIVTREAARFLSEAGFTAVRSAAIEERVAFNPNLDSVRFYAVMQVIQSITILSVVLVGAAVIREREHGTIEHLLVLPVHPWEIVLSKILANGAVILFAAWASLHLVVHAILGVPLAGSFALLFTGAALYLFASTSLGVLLATIVTNMPQYGLVAVPIFVMMNLLSGTITPLESMPAFLGIAMQASPSTHFVAFAQALLYRGAGIESVWIHLAAIVLAGATFLAASLLRFRAMLARQS